MAVIAYFETVKTVAAVIGPIVGGGGLWAWLRSRTSAPAEVAASQASIAEALAMQTKVILSEHAKDRRGLRVQVDRQGRQIAKLTKDVADCNIKHNDCESSMSRMQDAMDKMVAEGNVASTFIINPRALKEHVDAPD